MKRTEIDLTLSVDAATLRNITRLADDAILTVPEYLQDLLKSVLPDLIETNAVREFGDKE